MAEVNENRPPLPPSPARRGWAIAAIFAVVFAGAATWFWTLRGDESAQANANGVRSTLHLDTFVLNLADAEQRSYLRIGIDLGLSHEMRRSETLPIAELRDTILTVLAQSRADDLLTANGKSQLKDDLLHALQQRAPELGIQEVYFTEFLIQR
jgi:flagellar basal body-associated protein FliL